ncbi:MAG: dihydrolipoyl dehydrogenase [Bacteroides sp.]
MKKYQVAIIGGGPAGYSAAEKAGKAGLSVVLFEKNNLGGICLNEGCIPTKTLLYSAKIYDKTKDARRYAIQIPEASFDLKRIISRKKKVVRKLVMGIQAKMKEAQVEVIEGEAKITDSHTISCNDEHYSFDNLLICTGSHTFIPPIQGVDQVNYWTHEDALDAKELPKSLIIVGGGVIGMEFASFYNSLGTEVSVVEMMDEILPGMDKEVVEELRKEYSKKGIQFHLQTKVIAIQEDNEFCIQVDKEGKQQELRAEKVLLSVGRRPSTQGLGLEHLDLAINERKQFILNKQLQTTQPHIYICGDANGKSLLAHTAIREAEVAIHTILGDTDEMDYAAIPGIVYTNPEIAGVGKTEETLKKEGVTYSKKVIPMTYSGRFVAENEGINGICKLLIDNQTDQILGVHLLGNPASEIILTAAMAIELKLTTKQWNKIIFPHPTVAEIFKELL